MTPPKTAASVIIFVFVPFMVAYLLSELYRNINGIVGPIIKIELGLSIEYLGLMTSLFLAAVAGVQVFTGLWLDKYGPRKTVAALLLVGALGAFIFSTATHVGLLLGRFLIGIGMAGCWTAAFMVNSRWMPAERLVLANGAIIGFAGFGALLSTLPTQLLLNHISWNAMFLGLAFITAAVAILIFIVVPNHPDDSAHHPDANFIRQLRGFAAVLANPVFIRVAPISALGQGVWISYQGLWAGVWLREANQMAAIPAAQVLLFLAISVIAGNLFLGAIADILERHGVPVVRTMIFLYFVFIGTQIAIVLNFGIAPFFLWSLFGLTVASSLFVYALVARAVSADLVGRAMSLLNLLATLCAFVMQYSVGVIIELWQANPNGDYPLIAHQTAFGAIIFCQVSAFLWMVKKRAGAHD